MSRPTQGLQESLDALDDDFGALSSEQVEDLASLAELGRAVDDATQLRTR